jgi:hypothetical protein
VSSKAEPVTLPIAEAQQLQCPFRGGFAPCTTRSCMAWVTTDKGVGFCRLIEQRCTPS